MKKASATRSSPAAKSSKKKGVGPAKVATPKKGAAAAVTTTPKKGHPTFASMICEAIADIEGTVSRPAIAKWIKDQYPVNEAQFALHLKNGLAKAEEEEKIVKVKASYKLKAAKKSKEGSTAKKAAPKRKITTPKAKKPAKKRRTEKESESEGPEEEEEQHDEDEHEMESQEGTADEGSYETDAGPVEDITAEKPAEPESGSLSESLDGAAVARAAGQDESNEPGHAEHAVVESEPTADEPIERSAETEADEGPVEAEPSTDAEQKAEPSDSNTAMEAVESSAETSSVVDQPEVSADNANGADVETAELGEVEAEGSQQAVVEPKISEAVSPNEESVTAVPASNHGDDEVAMEATEQDANAAVITSIPVVQESDSIGPAEKAASIPGTHDSMAVETL